MLNDSGATHSPPRSHPGSPGALVASGAYGAVVACDRAMSRYLVNAAGTLAFSTSLPPPVVAGAMAALELLQSKPQRVKKLAANAPVLRNGLEREGFDVGDSRTQILPLVIGDSRLALRIGEAALLRELFVQAIGPPAVTPLTARLRLTVMATHREEELVSSARTLGAVARAEGFDPRSVPRRATPIRADIWAQDDDDAPDVGLAEPIGMPALRGVFDFEAPGPVRRAA